MYRRWLLMMISLFILLALAGCDLVTTGGEPETNQLPVPVSDTGVIAEANLVPAKFIALRFALPGQVSEINVTEGEEVEEGQILARQGNIEPLEAQLLAADLAVMEAEQQLEKAEQFRTDQNTLDLAEAALDLAKSQQRAAKKALENAKLTAPFAGKLVRIEIKEGVYTSPAEVAMILIDTSAWYLETNDLNENEVVRVIVGDKVEVLIDALPGKTFSGEVESISEYFLERFGNITYLVRIRLFENDEQLRWGMTAEVKFPE